MSNKFQITLTAKDKFSAVFDRLSKTAGRGARSTMAGSKTAESASRSTEKWARGMERVTRAATSSAGALRDAADPMMALGAMRFAGPLGAVVAMAAAVGTLTQKWAESTSEVGRTSKAFDVNAQDLQVWSAAAKRAGYDADAMAESYTRLSRAMYLARNAPSENPAVVAMMNKYGINPSGGMESAMRRIMAVLAANPTGNFRSRFGQELGLSEDSIRYLSRALGEVEADIAAVRREGSAQSDGAVTQAEEQRQALGRLSNAWDRLKNSIGAAVSPSMVRLLDLLSGTAPASGSLGGLLSGELTRGAGGAAPATGFWADLMRGGAIVGDSVMGPAPPASPFGSRDPVPYRQSSAASGSGSPDDELNRALGFKVEVTFANAPPGTSATVTSGGRSVPARISHAMPTGATP